MVENLVAPHLNINMEPINRIWVLRKNFKFENAWYVAPGITDIVSESWLSSSSKANDNGLKQEIDDFRRELNCRRNQEAAANPNILTNLRNKSHI